MFKLQVSGLGSRFAVRIGERIRERLGRMRTVARPSRKVSKNMGNASDQENSFETNVDTLSAVQDRRFRE